MNLATDKVYDILESKIVAFTGAIASIIGLLIAFWQVRDGAPIQFSQLAVYSALFLVAIFVGFYSVRVRSDKQALSSTFQHFHEINHLYRDVLTKEFKRNVSLSDSTSLLQQERYTLEAVCQRISTIFQLLTRRRCVVTLKLITENQGHYSTETYVRSEAKSIRENDHPKVFELKTGANSAFDEAMKFIPGDVSYFYSADLIKDDKLGKYRNQRPSWRKHYQSAIVVPVRFADPQKVGQNDATDDIGFLCVDTKSRNRLKDGFHVQILCAFADQMYNFMQLMRGQFNIAQSVQPVQSVQPAQSA